MNNNYFFFKKSWVLFLLLISTFSFGATRFSVAAGNWNSTSTWAATSGGASGASVPVAGDDVTIGGFTVTISANAACNSVNITSGGTLGWSGNFNLVISGAFTNAGIINKTGSGTINANCTNTGIFNAGGTGSITGINNNTGGIVNYTGTQAITTLTATTFGNTVNYNGGNQTVKATTYYNLTLSGSGIKTFGTVTTVNNLLAIKSGVVANLGTDVHPAAVMTLDGAGPLSSTWGSTSSNPVASNTNNTFFAATTGKININGTAPGTAIDNNYASYSNGVSGDVAGTSGEYADPPTNSSPGSLTLSAPPGSAFINVKFASYGLPGGTLPNFTIGKCHAFNSRAVTTGLLGSNVATVPPSGSFNNTFGDPCQGIVKSYNVVATYAQPFCTVGGVQSFVINGSTPTGGNGSFSYLWEVSTTSATAGYSPASGTNSAVNYTVPGNIISGTTWYRRTVSSGIYSDATIVIVQVVAGPPTVATTFIANQAACNGTTKLNVSGGSLGLGGYAEFSLADGTVLGTSNNVPANLTVTPTEGNTNYRVRYVNSCGTTAYLSTTATNTVSITAAATATPVCFSAASRNTSIVYTATTGTPAKYSITWNAAANTAGLSNQIDTGFTFAVGAGSLTTIAIPGNVAAGTYTGNLTVKNASGCVSFMNGFSVTVNALPTVTFTSSPGVSACANSDITYATQGSMSNYVWSVSGVLNTDYTISSGGTGASSSTVTLKWLTTGNKTVTVNYNNANGCSAVSSASSSTIVRAVFTTGTIASTGQTICYGGTTLTAIGSTTAASGGDGTITYSWRSSSDSYVADINGAIGATYTPPTGLTATTSYRRYAKDGTCNTIPTVSTNTWTVTVRPQFTAGTIASTGQTICYGGAPVAIGSTTAASGGDGIITYSWRSSADNYVAVISGATNATYIPPSGLTVTTSYQRYAKDGTCNTTPMVSTNKWTVAVNPNLPASVTVAPTATTICAGTAVTFTAISTNGGTTPTYQWKVNDADEGTNSTTFTSSTLVNGDLVWVVLTSNATPCLTGSPAPSNTITMVVTPTNSLTLTSASVTNNQTICFNTAINPITYATTGATGISDNGVLGANGLPAGVSASWASNTIIISGTPTVSGRFNYTIPLSGGCGAKNATGTITVGANSTYTTSLGWDNGIPNNNGFNAVIEGSYDTSSGNINACNCDVKSTGTLTIIDGTTVTIQNTITNNGTLTVKEGSNLIQINNAAINQGNIAVEKLFTFITPTTPIAHRQQYNYVISPVIGQVLKTIYRGSPAVLYHNQATNYFGTSTGAYIAGRGLAVKEPSEAVVSASTVTAQFSGVPFNGILEYPLAYTASAASLYGYNLVGNPYPSNLDLQSLYDYANGSDKNANKIEPTFEFWDNRGNLQFTQQGSGYSGDSYAKYNVIVGTGVASASAATNSQSFSDKRIPNQFVQVGTGFMVRALSTANTKKLVFSNTMRTDNKGESYFGRQTEKDRYWLTLKTPSAIELMNAVVYCEGGSNAFGLEDSKASESSDGIYSIVDEYKLAIQGRATFTASDKIDLGISAFVAGTYTISLLNQEGVFSNGQKIYLKDKQNGKVICLSEGSYSFNVNSGQSIDRFEIIYQPEIVLVTDSKVKEGIVVYRDQDDFVIKSSKTISMVQVYDSSGKLITVLRPNGKQQVLNVSSIPNGIYVLKIMTADGQVINKKISR